MFDAYWPTVWLSIQVAFLCLLLNLLPGIGVAWLLARKSFKGKVVFETLVHVPLVLPPVVTGYFLLILLGKNGWVGAWLDEWFGIRLAFDFSGAVLAAAVMSFPLLVRSLRLAIELVDPGLEIAAATLGARPLRVFWTVTLPLSMPGLLTGVVLAFARGLGEFGATITFAGNISGETRTLPLAVFTYMQMPGRDHEVLVLALIAVALSGGALLASELFSRRLARRLRGRP